MYLFPNPHALALLSVSANLSFCLINQHQHSNTPYKVSLRLPSISLLRIVSNGNRYFIGASDHVNPKHSMQPGSRQIEWALISIQDKSDGRFMCVGN